jgi:hypothetical protein
VYQQATGWNANSDERKKNSKLKGSVPGKDNEAGDVVLAVLDVFIKDFEIVELRCSPARNGPSRLALLL